MIMEATTSMFCSNPLLPSTSCLQFNKKTQLRHHSCSTTSVALVRESVPLANGAISTASLVHSTSSSTLLQEDHDSLTTCLDTDAEEERLHTSQDSMWTLDESLMAKEADSSNLKDYVKQLEWELLWDPTYWKINVSSAVGSQSAFSITEAVKASGVVSDPGLSDQSMSIPEGVLEALSLAKQAMLASKQAASFFPDSSLVTESESIPESLGRQSLNLEEEVTVRSTKHLYRNSKNRKLPTKVQDLSDSMNPSRTKNKHNTNNNRRPDTDNFLRLFLQSPECRKLLTKKEEEQLLVKVHDLMSLEELKQQLCTQSGTQPTLPEWAEAAGVSCRVLRSRLDTGGRSRDRMIHANLRLVVHIAKHYQGRGISMPDLLQAGSMGLMQSLEKFKPKAECRFSTYAYWWIRQRIRRSIFQDSRIIRLPESVYSKLTKVQQARKLCLQQGVVPSNEELAKCVGMTVEKLQRLLASTKNPISLQQRVRQDDKVTLEEVTADPKAESPEMYVERDLMRRHIVSLLDTLTPRERYVIKCRFGFLSGRRHTLEEISGLMNVTKQRVMQLEVQGLKKLKKYHQGHGLDEYASLLVS